MWTTMASYHLVIFNAGGMIDRVNVGTYSDDEAAKSAARDLDHDHIVEVTQNGVRVARVPPRSAAIAGRRSAQPEMSLSR